MREPHAKLFAVVVVQLLSCVRLVATPWTTARQASLSSTISWSLLKLMSFESVMPSNHLILCCPLFSLSPIFSSIRVLSNESALCIRWPKYWSFSLSLSPANEYSGWFPLRLTGLIHGYNFKIITNIFWPFCLRKEEIRLVAERMGSDGHPMN